MDLYDQALLNMEHTLHALAGRVPLPQRVPHMGSFAYRYVEKSIHQALVQKLARSISTLLAARFLLKEGFVQEQAALQRILDEINEDITFLSFGVIYDDITSLHQNYLEAFFEEEFDAETALASTQKRPMIPRKKIHAYIARIESMNSDPSTAVEVSRTVSKAYSGYIHAASPQIMDMYGGNPPKFHVRGMRNTPRYHEHRADLWNYFYRCIISFAFVAKAFGDDELFTSIREFTREFEHLHLKDYAPAE